MKGNNAAVVISEEEKGVVVHIKEFKKLHRSMKINMVHCTKGTMWSLVLELTIVIAIRACCALFNPI